MLLLVSSFHPWEIFLWTAVPPHDLGTVECSLLVPSRAINLWPRDVFEKSGVRKTDAFQKLPGIQADLGSLNQSLIFFYWPCSTGQKTEVHSISNEPCGATEGQGCDTFWRQNSPVLTWENTDDPAWRIISFSKWLVFMASKPPNWGCSPSK